MRRRPSVVEDKLQKYIDMLEEGKMRRRHLQNKKQDDLELDIETTSASIRVCEERIVDLEQDVSDTEDELALSVEAQDDVEHQLFAVAPSILEGSVDRQRKRPLKNVFRVGLRSLVHCHKMIPEHEDEVPASSERSS